MEDFIADSRSLLEASPESAQTFDAKAIAQNPAICAVLDSEGAVLNASAGFAHAVGRPIKDIAGRHITDFHTTFQVDDWTTVQAHTQTKNQYHLEGWVSLQDGTTAHLQMDFSAIRNKTGEILHYFLYACDLTFVKEAREQQLLKASQDPLTGLYNRRYLEHTLSDMIAACRVTGGFIGILVLDVNDFKDVNDTYGHNAGDQALCHVANAISEAVPLGEVITRYGGDEFVIALNDLQSQDNLHQIAEDILFAVSRPCAVGHDTITIKASLGVSIFPTDGQTLSELINHADRAMFDAKRISKQSAPTLSAPSHLQNSTLEDVSFGLTQNQFVPHYQPIVDLTTGHWVGVEALCRWNHPKRGLVLPRDFIPQAENSGLIVEIDKAMFRAICNDIATHRNGPLSDLQISFNLSAVTLSDPSFIDFLNATLRYNQLEAKNFCVELVESMTLIENDLGRECLFSLHQSGFSIALDDFGTGFSSLSLLKNLPVSNLKIDKSFITRLAASVKDRKIVESIVILCRALETSTVIQGVENKEQSEMLRDMGAQYAQGYHFGKPQPIDHLLTQLTKTHGDTS